MSNVLTLEDKIALAQSASDTDVSQLDAFCVEHNLPMADVTAWSTAYETGGSLGVEALINHWMPQPRVARGWHEDVKNAVKRFRPRRLRVKKDGNQFTVEEIKPLTARNIVHTPVFQLRVIRNGEELRWFLYWRRAGGGWWPYAGRPSFATPVLAVEEVLADPHRCFRLHPM